MDGNSKTGSRYKPFIFGGYRIHEKKKLVQKKYIYSYFYFTDNVNVRE